MKNLIKINLNQMISKAQIEFVRQERNRWIGISVISLLFIISFIFVIITNGKYKYTARGYGSEIRWFKNEIKNIKKDSDFIIGEYDIDLLSSFEKNRPIWSTKLEALSKLTPDDMSIEKIEYDNENLTIVAITHWPDGELHMPIANSFIDKIKNSPEFSNDFEALHFDKEEEVVISKGNTVLRFYFSAKLKEGKINK